MKTGIEVSHSLLRFLTCGSVDDGKSTLIGRLLYDSRLIMDDTLATIAKDSRKHGTVGEDIDLALLVDGLEAERQQGITIDVSYRFFATPKRSFIVADTPGHEQYTRNMATRPQPWLATRLRSALLMRLTSRVATFLRHSPTGPTLPTNSPHICFGWMRIHCCRAASI